jgi:hypothetical protein
LWPNSVGGQTDYEDPSEHHDMPRVEHQK